MSIRARLRIGLILVVAALVTTGVLLIEVSERLSTAREHSDYAQRLVAGAFRAVRRRQGALRQGR